MRLDADRDRIIEAYVVEEKSVRKLAAKLEVCTLTFRRWLKDNGITPRGMLEEGDVRRRKFLDARREVDAEIVRLRVEEDLAPQEIRDRLGVSLSRTYAVLRDAGVSGLAVNTDPPPQPKPPRGQARLSALKPEVSAAIGEGLSSNSLAKRFGVSQNSVLRWAESENLHFVNLTETQRRIVDLWKSSDLNMKAVAEQLECNRTTVSRTLRKIGLIDDRTEPGRPPGSGGGKRPARHRLGQDGEEDLSGGPSP